MTDSKEEITVSHEDLGARKGVLVTIREIDRGKVQALGRPAIVADLEAVSTFRIERQWNRGKSKEVMTRCDNRGEAEGFVTGVVAGIKLANA